MSEFLHYLLVFGVSALIGVVFGAYTVFGWVISWNIFTSIYTSAKYNEEYPGEAHEVFAIIKFLWKHHPLNILIMLFFMLTYPITVFPIYAFDILPYILLAIYIRIFRTTKRVHGYSEAFLGITPWKLAKVTIPYLHFHYAKRHLSSPDDDEFLLSLPRQEFSMKDRDRVIRKLQMIDSLSAETR